MAFLSRLRWVSTDEVSNSSNHELHFRLTIIAVVAVSGIVAKASPSRDLLLVVLVVRPGLRQVGIHRVEFWLGRNRDPMFATEFPQMLLKDSTGDDRCWVCGASIQGVFGHFKEVGEEVSVDQFFKALQPPGIVVGPKGAQGAPQPELDLLVPASADALLGILEDRLHLFKVSTARWCQTLDGGAGEGRNLLHVFGHPVVAKVLTSGGNRVDLRQGSSLVVWV